MLSGDHLMPSFAALIFARVSIEIIRFAAEIRAHVSEERFCPRLVAAILSRLSKGQGPYFFPRWAAAWCARHSAGITRPLRAAVIFSWCSGLFCLPRMVAEIFAARRSATSGEIGRASC